MSKKSLPGHEIGSGNIFADLGLPNAEEHQQKAALVVQLRRLIKERKLSQVEGGEAARHQGAGSFKHPRDHYEGYALARLIRMLTAFDRDVEITTRLHGRMSL